MAPLASTHTSLLKAGYMAIPGISGEEVQFSHMEDPNKDCHQIF